MVRVFGVTRTIFRQHTWLQSQNRSKQSKFLSELSRDASLGTGSNGYKKPIITWSVAMPPPRNLRYCLVLGFALLKMCACFIMFLNLILPDFDTRWEVLTEGEGELSAARPRASGSWGDMTSHYHIVRISTDLDTNIQNHTNMYTVYIYVYTWI